MSAAANDNSWTGSWLDLRTVKSQSTSGVLPDLSAVLFKDGSIPLIANWNQGPFNLTNTESYWLGKVISSNITVSYNYVNRTCYNPSCSSYANGTESNISGHFTNSTIDIYPSGVIFQII